jgi:large subunit ribosomal protein L24
MKTKTKKARKQRGRAYRMSLHQKHSLLSARLDKPLVERFQRSNLEVRRGDRVRVAVGTFKGVEGEVVKVDVSQIKIYVDKVVSKKRDGTEVLKPVHPSNLILTDIDLMDKRRQRVLERKVGRKVVEEEVKREEEKRKAEEEAKKREEERKKREEETKKREEEEKKAAREKKVEEKAKEKGRKPAKKEPEKVSEKGIDKKIKKEWIKEK